MKTEHDIRFLRDAYLKLAKGANVDPELIRRYKFAVNFCDHLLDQATTFGEEKHFRLFNPTVRIL